MIKKFNEFINESVGPNKEGSISINLSEEESELFTTEPKLSELIHDKKVALLTPELWFNENDKETINTLNNYFDVNVESENETETDENLNEKVNESSLSFSTKELSVMYRRSLKGEDKENHDEIQEEASGLGKVERMEAPDEDKVIISCKNGEIIIDFKNKKIGLR